MSDKQSKKNEKGGDSNSNNKNSSNTSGGGDTSAFVKLNVGGVVLRSTKATLAKYPSSLLAKLVDDKAAAKDETGAILLDVDARHFEVVLNWLRYEKWIVDSSVSRSGVEALCKKLELQEMLDQMPGEPIFSGAVQAYSFLNSLTSIKQAAGMDFSGLDLTNVFCEFWNLRNARFLNSRLFLARFRRADLTNCSFAYADLRNAEFAQCTLINAVFYGADLQGADFTDAIMVNCDLRTANLKGATLTGADLTEADLEGATITEADTTGANFTEANLSNVVYDTGAAASEKGGDATANNGGEAAAASSSSGTN